MPDRVRLIPWIVHSLLLYLFFLEECPRLHASCVLSVLDTLFLLSSSLSPCGGGGGHDRGGDSCRRVRDTVLRLRIRPDSMEPPAASAYS